MLGAYLKTRFVAVLVICLVAACVAIQAGAASTKSGQVPGNLRSLVLKLGPNCAKLHVSNDQCIMGPFMVKQFTALAKKYPAVQSRLQSAEWRGLMAFYRQTAPVCNPLRPGRPDGALGLVTFTIHKGSYVELECSWIKSRTVSVRVLVAVPFVAHKMSTDIGCDASCNLVAGGWSKIFSYDTVQQAGGVGEWTNVGWVRITRQAKSRDAFLARQPDDVGMFQLATKALGMPS